MWSGLNKSFITYSPLLILPSIHGVFKGELLIVCFHLLRNRANVPLIRRCACLTLFCGLFPRDAQRVCSVKSNGHESVLHGSYVCRHRRTTAQGGVHGAFMTLAPYTRIREGEGHELFRGVRNGSHRARSRPCQKQTRAVNGKVQALQPKRQLIGHPVGGCSSRKGLTLEGT